MSEEIDNSQLRGEKGCIVVDRGGLLFVLKRRGEISEALILSFKIDSDGSHWRVAQRRLRVNPVK